MRELSRNNFGIVIAYLLPGLVVLAGISRLSSTVGSWLSASGAQGPTVGGFLFATLASLAAGMIVSVVRWALVDSLHHAMGIREPVWRFSSLQERFDAFEGLVENHYRYYQFYANTLVAVVISWCLHGAASATWSTGSVSGDLGVFGLGAILFLGSRDSLRKYYERTRQLLGDAEAVAP